MLQAFKKTAKQLIVNFFLASRESIILTIPNNNNKDYDDQKDINLNNNEVY